MLRKWRDELHLIALIAVCPALASGLAISGITIGHSAVWQVLALALAIAVPIHLAYTALLLCLFDHLRG